MYVFTGLTIVDAGLAELPLDAVLHDRVDLRELLAAVDRQHVLRRHRLHRHHLLPGVAEDAVDVGEVVLALLVLVLQLRQGEQQLVEP